LVERNSAQGMVVRKWPEGRVGVTGRRKGVGRACSNATRGGKFLGVQRGGVGTGGKGLPKLKTSYSRGKR